MMRSSLSFLCCGIAVLMAIQSLGFTNVSEIFKEKIGPQTPPRHIEHMTFGFPELLADTFWLRLLQDLDRCFPAEGAVNSASNTSRISNNKMCNMGWGYYMLLSIHDLAPRFRIPMAVGPMSLSVLQNDYEGAGKLFVLAAESFPNDWPILYRAAYHFLYEGKDADRAAGYLRRAAKLDGAPWWLNSLAARLYQKEGKIELALRTLQDYRKTLTDPEQQKKVDERIKALQASLAE